MREPQREDVWKARHVGQCFLPFKCLRAYIIQRKPTPTTHAPRDCLKPLRMPINAAAAATTATAEVWIFVASAVLKLDCDTIQSRVCCSGHCSVGYDYLLRTQRCPQFGSIIWSPRCKATLQVCCRRVGTVDAHCKMGRTIRRPRGCSVKRRVRTRLHMFWRYRDGLYVRLPPPCACVRVCACVCVYVCVYVCVHVRVNIWCTA